MRSKPESSDASRGCGSRTSTRPRARIAGWKKWVLRVALVFLAPVLAIGLLEGALSLFNCGRPTSYWIKSKRGGAYVSNPVFGVRFFGQVLNRPVIPASISRPKPKNTYRIFVFGGSAALGTPDTAFSFAHILEAMLNDRFPGTRFEVVNTAMTATNSHVAYEIAKDCRPFGGDLYIVYSGNNEVVGPYGPGTVFLGHMPALWAIRMNASVKATRSGQLLSSAFGGPRGPEKWSGMRMFLENLVTADDPSLESTYENFRANLRDICREAERAGAKVILSTVITNLKDLPPFASVHRPDLPADEEKLWDALYEEGVVLQKSGNHAGALERYLAAERIDDAFGELHFRIGTSLLALKQTGRAKARFVRARDLDALRFRADTRINEIIRTTAAELGPQGVHLVDAENAISGQNDPGRIHGSELLYEHVHLKFEGNYALAAAVFRRVASLLPPSIREGVAADVTPPSLERAAALVVFTPYARYRLTAMMAGLTGRAPFPEERRAWDETGVRRLKAHVTPRTLADTARAYRERLTVCPNDFLLRTGFAALEKSRRRYASAVEQYEEALRLIPDDPKAHDNLGSSLQGLGRFEEAIKQHEEALRLKPGAADAHNNLGSALLGLKRFAEAVSQYEEALRLKPDSASTHDNLGNTMRAQERFKEAVGHYEKALQLEPGFVTAHNNLADSLQHLGRLAEAVEHYEKTLQLKPGQPTAHNNLGSALLRLGRVKEAVGHYEKALQLKPGYVTARNNLVGALPRLERSNETVAHYERVLQLKPDLVSVRNGLALLLQRLGRFKDAITHFEEIARLKPDSDSAHNNLGWLRATCPDPEYRDAEKAEASARRACELTGWKHFGALDTLGAAYAAGGKFDEAVKWQSKALELAPERAKADLRSRLELYAAGKPYRMPTPRPPSK